MREEAFLILGNPRPGGILVVGDHASNRVPEDIDLGIDPALLDEHVAIDIGVKLCSETISRGSASRSRDASAAWYGR